MSQESNSQPLVDVFGRLGVKTIINAQGHHTVLGNTVLPTDVLAAMNEAAKAYVDMHEFMARAGEHIARLTHNEDAYVCGGASSGLFLAVLAVMTGGDQRAIDRLPAIDGLPNEFVIHRSHRVPPDLPVLLTGARWREVGTAAGTTANQVLAVVGRSTAGIVYMPNEDFEAGAMSLADTLEVARTAGIPVIVDAAAELPPPSNLWYFTRQLGADLAVFSGGKALCGPPGAGIVVGRRDLVDACRRIGHPHNGVGRAMKVSKEDVAGLLQAIESFLSLDHVGRQKRFVSTLDYWEETIGRLPGIQAVRVRSSRIDRSEWRIRLIVDPGVTGLTAAEIRAKLWHGEPRIAVMVPAQGGEVQLTPYTLQPGEDVIVATAFADAIGKCLSC